MEKTKNPFVSSEEAFREVFRLLGEKRSSDRSHGSNFYWILPDGRELSLQADPGDCQFWVWGPRFPRTALVNGQFWEGTEMDLKKIRRRVEDRLRKSDNPNLIIEIALKMGVSIEN